MVIGIGRLETMFKRLKCMPGDRNWVGGGDNVERAPTGGAYTGVEGRRNERYDSCHVIIHPNITRSAVPG